MTAPIDADSLAAAHASYERAASKPEFYTSFYTTFFRLCPDARQKFAKTHFERQHQLLHHAIGMLLIYPKHMSDEPNLLSRLAKRHGREDLNIPGEMYPPFVDALVTTLKECDSGFSVDLEWAWRAILAVGIKYMRSKYSNMGQG